MSEATQDVKLGAGNGTGCYGDGGGFGRVIRAAERDGLAGGEAAIPVGSALRPILPLGEAAGPLTRVDEAEERWS